MTLGAVRVKLEIMKRSFMTPQTQTQPTSQLINKLKEWSQLNTPTVLFDSDIDGNGWNTLPLSCYGKSGIYLISIDNNKNIYGGYISTIIDKYDWIYNINSFLVSLMRNGHMNNKLYKIKQYEDFSFRLYFNNKNGGWLYAFGRDIVVKKIGNSKSTCEKECYEYYNVEKPFVDKVYPATFPIQRILVIQMS
ncbi:TLDc domain-containing protein [Entamoeba marina]